MIAKGEFIGSLPIEQRVKEQNYPLIKQGNLTNEFAKSRIDKSTPEDSTGERSFKTSGGLVAVINEFNLNLTTSAHQLLDFLVSKITVTGGDTLLIPVDEYMKLRGMDTKPDNVKEFCIKVKKDLDAIYSAEISYSDKSRKNGDYQRIRILSSQGIKRRVIEVTFSQKVSEYLKNSPLMPYPRTLWTINPRTNPNSYNFGRMIAVHKNMNAGKPNENTIKVSTLLESSPYTRSQNDAEELRKHYKTKIMTPFIRDLNALNDMGEWCLFDPNGKVIQEADIVQLRPTLFEECSVSFRWKNYPDQTERLKKAAEKKKAQEDRAIKVDAEKEARLTMKREAKAKKEAKEKA